MVAARRIDMPLPRLQLFEFNDLGYVPAAVRDTLVESLSRTLDWGRILAGLVAPFERFLAETRSRQVLDIGSGGGGPARILAREIARTGRKPPRFMLTDLHPRVEVWTRVREEQPGAIDGERCRGADSQPSKAETSDFRRGPGRAGARRQHEQQPWNDAAFQHAMTYAATERDVRASRLQRDARTKSKCV